MRTELRLPHAIIDLAARVVVVEGEGRHKLTPIEARLLGFLATRSGRPATRSELLEQVWGYAPSVVSRAVDATVGRVRGKIELDPKDPKHLRTEWGAGYSLVGLLEQAAEVLDAPVDPVLVCSILPDAGSLARSGSGTWPAAVSTYIKTATEALQAHGGYRVQCDGDELLAAFASSRQALNWCVHVQLALPHGPRISMAVSRDAITGFAHPTTAATAYRGPGVRTVRARAAACPPGAIHIEADLLTQAGQVEVTATPPHVYPTASRGHDARADEPGDVFLGRGLELERIGAVLAAHRLVTLHGTGGIGKTALARRIPEELGVRGSLFCSLEGAHRIADVVGVLARALGVTMDLPSVEAATRRIGSVLAARESLLLILDNAEQIAAELAEVVAVWLEAAPELNVLVTSRRPLGLPMERCFELGPLREAEATALFDARVREARARPCTPQEDAAVHRIVEATGAIPLALELAAARSRLLDLSEIAERLVASSRLLAKADRGGERHGSMESALAWSWSVLDSWSQRVLGELSWFAGPFTTEAVEALVQLPPEAPWVVDVLDSLARDALIHPADGQERRLRLLVPIRQFVRERRVESEGTRDRYLGWFASRSDRAFLDGLDGPDERLRTEQLRVEKADVQVAFELACELERMEIAASCWLATSVLHRRFLPAAAGLESFERLDLACLGPELRSRCELAAADLERLLSPTGAVPRLEAVRRRAPNTGLEARAGVAEAGARLQSGEYGEIEQLLQVTLERSRQAKERATEATALLMWGVFLTHTGDPSGGADRLMEALELARRLGAISLRGKVLTNLGSALHAAGKPDAAWEIYTAALQVHRTGPEPRSLARLQISRGNLAVARGQLDVAAQCFEQALGIFRDHADDVHEAMVLLNLTQVHLVRGELDACEAPLQRALLLVRAAKNGPSEAYTRMNLSRTRALQGRWVEAVGEGSAALAILATGHAALATASAHLVLAEALACTADHEAARHHADAGIELLSTLDLPQIAGRLWLVHAELDGDPEVVARAGALLTRAGDIEALAVLATLEPGGLERAIEASDQLGCGPRSRLAVAIARSQPGPVTP